MKHLAEHAEEDFHPRAFSKKPKDDDDDDNNDDHDGGGRLQGKGVGRQIKAALPMQHNHASTSFNNAPSNYDNYRSRTQDAPSEISEQPVLSRKPSPALERYLNDKESPVPIPLEYQKYESQDTQLATRTLPNNSSEMRYQEVEASDRNTRPLNARKRSPSLGIPLVQIPQTLLSSKMKPYSVYPIPIPSDKHERALQLYVKYRREEKLALALEHTSSRYLFSVISFDDRESSSSGKNRVGELISFDGKTVQQRARKRLSPTAKAKAALIRCLGSCWVCRSRRVPVSNFE